MREPISRRELVGGGLFFGALILAGCKSVPAESSIAGGMGAPVPGPLGQQTLESTVEVTVGPVADVADAPEPIAPVDRIAQAGPAVPEILPRSSWTNAGVVNTFDLVPMGGIRRITVHHDGLDAFTSIRQRDSAARIEAIRRIHLGGGVGEAAWGAVGGDVPSKRARRDTTRADIGYHFAIDPAGRIFACRHINVQGCHVDSYNQHNLGIVCLGDFDRQQPSPAMLASLQLLISFHMLKDEIPLPEVRTHRECPNPSFRCPGRFLQGAMETMRAANGALDVLWRSASPLAPQISRPMI